MKHSNFSASGATRFLNCTASIALSDGINEMQSPYAAEGTLAHDYAEKLLFLNQEQINPILYDNPDMIEGAKVYRDHIFSVLSNTNDFRLRLEQRIDLAFIDKDLFGTADCIIEDYQNEVIHIIDFKYGRTKIDPNCDQLKYYASGAIYQKPFKAAVLTIIQPRLRNKTIDKVRSHVVSKAELTEFCILLNQKVKEIKLNKVEFITGQWCFFCKAKTICPEYQSKTLTQAKNEFTVITKEN